MLHGIALLCFTTRSRPPADLVVDGSPQSSAVIRQRASLTPEGRAAELAAAGYTEVTSGGVSYYFSEEVWQAKAMADLARSYEPFENSLGADRSISATSNTTVSRFLNERLADMGYQLAPGQPAYTGVTRTCTMQVGSKTLLIQTGDPALSNRIANQPRLQPVDEAHRREFGHRHTLLFAPGGTEAFSAYGELATDRKAAADAYVTATELLGAHWRQFHNRSRAKLQSLVDKLSGYRIRDYYGVAGSNLPQDLRDRLFSGLNHFTASGFVSAAEARAWLNQANLTGSNASVTIFTPGPPNSRLSGIGLDPP
ncbi:MAG: hypothetical protein ACYC96_01895 [Fimbriimonadaceae bacterium]